MKLEGTGTAENESENGSVEDNVEEEEFVEVAGGEDDDIAEGTRERGETLAEGIYPDNLSDNDRSSRTYHSSVSPVRFQLGEIDDVAALKVDDDMDIDYEESIDATKMHADFFRFRELYYRSRSGTHDDSPAPAHSNHGDRAAAADFADSVPMNDRETEMIVAELERGNAFFAQIYGADSVDVADRDVRVLQEFLRSLSASHLEKSSPSTSLSAENARLLIAFLQCGSVR